MKIRRVLKYYFLVVLMGLVSLAVTVSGFVLWLALPRGGGQGKLLEERSFWALSRDSWLVLHDWGGVALMAVALVHIVLHWRWLVNMTTQLSRPLRQKKETASPAPVPVTVED